MTGLNHRQITVPLERRHIIKETSEAWQAGSHSRIWRMVNISLATSGKEETGQLVWLSGLHLGLWLQKVSVRFPISVGAKKNV